jgi:hypothetical protein
MMQIKFLFSFRIRVGRSIQGFSLSPGITKEQRVAVEKLAASALSKLTGIFSILLYYSLVIYSKQFDPQTVQN